MCAPACGKNKSRPLCRAEKWPTSSEAPGAVSGRPLPPDAFETLCRAHADRAGGIDRQSCQKAVKNMTDGRNIEQICRMGDHRQGRHARNTIIRFPKTHKSRREPVHICGKEPLLHRSSGSFCALCSCCAPIEKTANGFQTEEPLGHHFARKVWLAHCFVAEAGRREQGKPAASEDCRCPVQPPDGLHGDK